MESIKYVPVEYWEVVRDFGKAKFVWRGPLPGARREWNSVGDDFHFPVNAPPDVEFARVEQVKYRPIAPAGFYWTGLGDDARLIGIGSATETAHKLVAGLNAIQAGLAKIEDGVAHVSFSVPVEEYEE